MFEFLDFGTLINGTICFILLVAASWCVGEGGEILGEKYDASIIGGLLIAWLNTAPEAIFFINALRAGHPRFAVGAVSGSSIVVSTIALGACIWIGASARKQGTIVLQPAIRRQCVILLASCVIPLLITMLGFNFMIGVLGVLFYLAFLLFSLTRGDEEEDAALSKKLDDVEAGEDPDADPPHPHEFGHDGEPASLLYGCLLLAIGAVLIVLCSTPFIDAVVDVANKFHINPVLLAFFLAPVASEMPEILESISLSRRGISQSINIAFSNLVGGTITKTSLLCSVFCFYGVYKDFKWESPSYTISLGFLICSALMASCIGAFVSRPTKYHGLALFILFLFISIVQYIINVVPPIDDLPPNDLPAVHI
mmetsp:Transcript_8568/g.14793  ORF Transcript_8568/g.14793 Transcript_8568/m.14793 type:complete len:367 (+) Transcript_8568:96-1196(+)